MGKLTNIIVHRSASSWGCAREIRRWHMENGWRDIGYHFVILNGMPKSGTFFSCLDGAVECGRDLDGDSFLKDYEIGAHALGYNRNSIGVVLIGVRTFTKKQKKTLLNLLGTLCAMYNIPRKNILGHYETAAGNALGKTCPNLKMDMVRIGLNFLEEL